MAARIHGLESRSIRGHGDVAIDGLQLEITWVRSDTGSGMSGGLPGNHLRFVFDLSHRTDLEELFDPKLAPELHAVLVRQGIRPGNAEPMLFDVPKRLFQRCPVVGFVAGLFLAWFLSDRQRRQSHQHRYEDHPNTCHCKSPPPWNNV